MLHGNSRNLGSDLRVETITDVPGSLLERVRQDFRDAGALEVRSGYQWLRGGYRVTAIFRENATPVGAEP